jgi:putative protease
MNIVTPLKKSEVVVHLLDAGADEFYCGISPPGWESTFGTAWSSRRSPHSAGVSDIADLEKMLRLSEGKPVFIALNAPFYPHGGVEMLAEFAIFLLQLGASGWIVADMELMLELIERGYAAKIHVSSLATCTNRSSMEFFRDLGVSRVILPRHLTVREIEALVVPGLEFEAFMMNDGCVFEEGLCATTHAAGPYCEKDGEGEDGISVETQEKYAFWKWLLNSCGCRTSQTYPMGPCGVCALPRLLNAGVSHFKVVGREASLQRKLASVHLASTALRSARAGATPEEIRQEVIRLRGVGSLCLERHLCYYPDVWEDADA